MRYAEPDHPHQPRHAYLEITGVLALLLLLKKEVAENGELVIKLFQGCPTRILGKGWIGNPSLVVNKPAIRGEALEHCTGRNC